MVMKRSVFFVGILLAAGWGSLSILTDTHLRAEHLPACISGFCDVVVPAPEVNPASRVQADGTISRGQANIIAMAGALEMAIKDGYPFPQDATWLLEHDYLPHAICRPGGLPEDSASLDGAKGGDFTLDSQSGQFSLSIVGLPGRMKVEADPGKILTGLLETPSLHRDLLATDSLARRMFVQARWITNAGRLGATWPDRVAAKGGNLNFPDASLAALAPWLPCTGLVNLVTGEPLAEGMGPGEVTIESVAGIVGDRPGRGYRVSVHHPSGADLSWKIMLAQPPN